MSCDKDVCFGCNGGFDGEDEIASRYKSTLAEFKFDLRIEKEDVESSKHSINDMLDSCTGSCTRIYFKI